MSTVEEKLLNMHGSELNQLKTKTLNQLKKIKDDMHNCDHEKRSEREKIGKIAKQLLAELESLQQIERALKEKDY